MGGCGAGAGPAGGRGMSANWDDYSERQLDALLELDFAMPVHEGYALRRLGLRHATIKSLEKRGLIRRVYYREKSELSGVPFLTLTQEGRAVQRDWVRWCRSVKAKVGSVPPGPMQRAADARP